MQYKIYQIKDIRSCPYAFINYEYARAHGLRLSDYKCVYAEEITVDLSTDIKLMNYLEHLFDVFNISPPKDFCGHSLSVSDIIFIDGKGFFYVDRCGFKKID